MSLAAQAIGVRRDDVPERSAQNEEQRKDLISRKKELKAEIAKMVAERAVGEISEQAAVWVQRTEKGTHDFDFLGAVASTFVLSEEKAVIVVTSTPLGMTPSLLLIQSKDQNLAKEVNEKLKGALEGGENGKGRVKGGGAKGRYMSKVEGKWTKEDVVRVMEVIEEVCRWSPARSLLTGAQFRQRGLSA